MLTYGVELRVGLDTYLPLYTITPDVPGTTSILTPLLENGADPGDIFQVTELVEGGNTYRLELGANGKWHMLEILVPD